MADDPERKELAVPGANVAPLRVIPADQGTHIYTTHVVGLTQEAAMAYTEMNRLQHAVPAEEKTKQAKEETKRHVLTLVGVLALAGLICANPTVGWPLAALGAVLSGRIAISDYLKKKFEKKD